MSPLSQISRSFSIRWAHGNQSFVRSLEFPRVKPVLFQSGVVSSRADRLIVETSLETVQNKVGLSGIYPVGLKPLRICCIRYVGRLRRLEPQKQDQGAIL
jgi:hypothetical protein